MILAFVAPFVGLYTFYICGIIGMSIVSENKNIDIGIGDAWYVPLENNYQLLFIDLPEQANISKESGLILVSEVSKIEEYRNQIFGETFDDKYFLVNTKTDEVKTFDTEKELSALHINKKLHLIDAAKFYSERKDLLMGYWLWLVGLLSFIISIGAIWIWKQFLFLDFRKPSQMA